jgi:hypothetical protein
MELCIDAKNENESSWGPTLNAFSEAHALIAFELQHFQCWLGPPLQQALSLVLVNHAAC